MEALEGSLQRHDLRMHVVLGKDAVLAMAIVIRLVFSSRVSCLAVLYFALHRVVSVKNEGLITLVRLLQKARGSRP